MEQYLLHFPAFIHLPLAQWVDAFINWLTVAAQGPFGAISTVLGAFLHALERFFIWLPWPVTVASTAALGWRFAGKRMALGIVLGWLLVGSTGIWTVAMETLALVITGTVLSVAIGVPVGIATAQSDAANRIVQPLLDFMQTMPSFVYLIPALFLFGLGAVPALFATFIYAVPPAIRLTNLGIRTVPAEVVEAGKAFGSTRWQLLLKVQLPVALPTIMAGVNQTVMMALAMVVIASMIGAGGLGEIVLRAIGRLQVGSGFVGGMGIVVLAIMIDRLSQSFLKGRRPVEG